MDADGLDDIVYLTTTGELGILYGTKTAGVFDKNILDTSLGIAIHNTTTSHGGAISHLGISQNSIKGQSVSNGKAGDENVSISDDVIRNQVFFQENIAPIEKNTSETLSSDTNIALKEKSEEEYAQELKKNTRIFARSQFANLVGATVSKKFTPPSSNAKILP